MEPLAKICIIFEKPTLTVHKLYLEVTFLSLFFFFFLSFLFSYMWYALSFYMILASSFMFIGCKAQSLRMSFNHFSHGSVVMTLSHILRFMFLYVKDCLTEMHTTGPRSTTFLALVVDATQPSTTWSTQSCTGLPVRLTVSNLMAHYAISHWTSAPLSWTLVKIRRGVCLPPMDIPMALQLCSIMLSYVGRLHSLQLLQWLGAHSLFFFCVWFCPCLRHTYILPYFLLFHNSDGLYLVMT